MTSIQIPKRYKYPLCAVLRKFNLEQGIEWNARNVKKCLPKGKIRDPEIESAYFELEKSYTTLQDFCERIPYSFIIKEGHDVVSYSNGPEIMFNVEKRAIYFNKCDLYWIPPGVSIRTSDVNSNMKGLTSKFYNPNFWLGKSLDLNTILELEEIFEVKFEIWARTFSKKETRNLYSQLYLGHDSYPEVKYFHYQEETSSFLIIDDPHRYFDKLFECPVPFCFYSFRTRKLLDDHQIHCAKESLKIEQKEYGNSCELITRAENHGLIPRCGVNRNYLFFDIESVLPSSNVRTQKTVVLSSHKLVSLAVNR